MPKRSSRQEDANQAAYRVVREAVSDDSTPPAPSRVKKNPAAVALGRRGGLKGGKARAAKLSKEERSAIAKKAARTRWDKRETGL